MNSVAPPPPVPVAVIGIGCLFPKAEDLARYWANIRDGVDAITDVPATHWRPEDYYDPDPKAPDKTYARRGGFLDPVDFPALEFGIAPHNLDATDTTQLLGLLVSRRALDDAGYGAGGGGERAFDRDRVSVILGVTGTLELAIPLGARLGHPIWRRALKESGVDGATAETVVQKIADSYVGWQENSFPGLLGNVAAGRIANRLDLGGTNCVIDAACASSLGALNLALLELAAGRCDMALTGGFDTFNDIFMYMCFSKTPALSPTGDARPFDASCDGTILGEGLGALVLKRWDDAKRDGDRVYAVIRSVGTSSDGKGNAVYAPSAAGQAKALRQAYQMAGIEADTIELVEAHGTGTKVGDATELAALTEVYREARAEGTWCALGSVKSQIGHTKAAAGAAGLIKAVLALHHKVLPPTAKVTRPVMGADSPFYANVEARPWLSRPEHPRRAAVSAFGFGGSNFHCVLEEADTERTGVDWDGDVQIVALSAENAAGIKSALDAWPRDPSWDAFRGAAALSRERFRPEHPHRLVFVAERGADRARLFEKARAQLAASAKPSEAVSYGTGPAPGPLAMLFPGQGSQYVGMLRDLACRFPEFPAALAGAGRVSDRIYPQPDFSDEGRALREQELRDTAVAQPAIGAVSLGLLGILGRFGVRADVAAGHSFGELTALRAAGRIDDEAFHRLASRRGALMAERAGSGGAMLAVFGPIDRVEAALRDGGLDLVIANKNAPEQAVLSGPAPEIERAVRLFERARIATRPLAVSAAFHSRFVAEASGPFSAELRSAAFAPARIPVYSNTTAEPYPDDPDEARALLAGQLARPVEFVAQVEALYRSGVRTFLEVGPDSKLTGLVGAILGDRAHEALAVDSSRGRKGNVADLARALARLAALGHPVLLTRWDEGFSLEPAPKPGMTVKLSGANVAPRRPQPEHNGKPHGHAMTNGTPHKTAPRPLAAGDPSLLAQALQSAQEGLIALQKLSEQTANLHRQFLEGQEKTQHAFQALLGQQQRLVSGTIELAPTPRREPLPAAPPGKHGPATPAAHPPARREPDPPPPPAPPQSDRAPSVLREVVAEKTGYPIEILDLDMQLDADLGIDSIKRVEILSALQERLPEAPVIKPEHLGTLRTLGDIAAFLGQTEHKSVSSGVQDVLIAIVAEKTGYPAEMLEPGMQLDADLGIDSIKRVEILSALQERLPEAPVIKPEHLGTLRTLGDIAAFLGQTEHKSVSSGVQDVLIAIVAEKTGYPAEMLEPAMQLDADLGIDSIKRVEILSAVQERLPEAPAIKPEHLGTLRTLGDIAAFLGASRPTPEPAPPSPDLPPTQVESVQRLVLRSVALDDLVPATTIELRDGGAIGIAGDDPEVAEALAARLNTLGYNPFVIPEGSPPTPDRLDGLVLLSSAGGDAAVQDAFRILRLAAPGLRRAGRESTAVFVTVSRLGGNFGLNDLASDAEPSTGAWAGLAKTAGHEWPEVRCKAIDLGPAHDDPDEAAGAIVEEMFREGPSEVGLTSAGRTTLELIPAPFHGGGRAEPFRQGDVVVMTGGARGITAEVAVALAQAFRPTLVVLGRTPEPHPEADWLAPLSGEAEIKRALATRANGHATPQSVGDQFRRLAANREILQNLERIAASGARVEYRSVDVRDEAAVRVTLDAVRAEFGPIRGLIHGAGVLADRQIEAQTDEQFARVYDTKVLGLRGLLRAIGHDDLKALVLFSSSTARFGRAGQVAYAAANEVLNKTAQSEARRRPGCRVVAVNWGPWDGGMVTGALKPLFEAEGVALIPLRAGARYLVDELRTTTDRPVEVVVLGGASMPEGLAPPRRGPGQAAASAAAGPLATVFERPIDLASLPILKAHIIDGRAVLPMALILEWLAHGALQRHPGLVFAGVNDLRLLKGVILRDGHTETVRALAGKAVRREGLYMVPVELRGCTRDGRDVLHARGEVVLADRQPQGKPSLGSLDLPPFRTIPQELYARVLFHGPGLQGIEQVEGCGESGIVAQVSAAPPPSDWIERPMRQAWLADPLALDCAFQLMIVWSAERFDAGSLPTLIGGYRQYRRAFPAEGVRVVAKVTQASALRAVADVEFLDADGALVARIDDYECVIDPSLNQAFRRNHTALMTPR